MNVRESDTSRTWLDSRSEFLDTAFMIFVYRVGEMNEHRKQIVRKVFKKLDPHKTGKATSLDLQKLYSAKKHPAVVEGGFQNVCCYRKFRCYNVGMFLTNRPLHLSKRSHVTGEQRCAIS